MVARESITIANDGIEEIIINGKTGEQTNEGFAADDLSSFDVCKLEQRLLGNRVSRSRNGIRYQSVLFDRRPRDIGPRCLILVHTNAELRFVLVAYIQESLVYVI